jgi:hypothetical protein
MKRLFILLTLLAVSIAPAFATVKVPPRPSSLIDVQIVDRTTGQTLETWRHRGKLYVVGVPNNRYAVSLRNRTGKRVLTVLSVDGVNALSGESAKISQRGYVLSAGQTTEVAGWRKSQNEVAAFYFTSIADSYAGRTDRPDNVGVIGVAVFREYEPPPPVQVDDAEPGSPVSRSGAGTMKKAAKLSAAPAAAQESLGTGHGERIESKVTTVEFKRASHIPAEVVSIYYDSRANLESRGIIPKNPRHPRDPQPFPNNNYVPDPPR